MTKYPFKTSKDILEEKLEDMRRYIQVLYKENQELKEIINNKPKPTSIDRRFREEAINAMYDEQDDYHTGF